MKTDIGVQCVNFGHEGIPTLNRVIPRPPYTIILAWGNDFRRDDGAGRVAARMLRDIELPGVEVVDFNQLCPEHAELLLGRDCVIFLDAFPAEPGQDVLLLPLDHPEAIKLPRSCFGHAVQPVEIMTLSRAVYGCETEAWLAAIPGFDFELGEDLSPATARGVHRVIAAVKALLKRDIEAGRNGDIVVPQNSCTHKSMLLNV